MGQPQQDSQRNVPRVQDRLDRFALRKSLPGTREFRVRLNERKADSLRQAGECLERLQAVDEETKDRIAQSIRSYDDRMAEADAWRDAVFELLNALFLLVALLGFNFGVLYVTHDVLHSNAQVIEIQARWWDWGWIWLVYVALSSLCLTVVFRIPSALMIKAPAYLRFRQVLLLWVVAVVGLCVYLIMKPPATGYVGFFVVSVASGVVFLLAVNFVRAGVVTFFEHLLEQRRDSQYPDAALVSQLLRILRRVETGEWTDLELKGDLLGRLEKAARCLERYLPRQLRPRDHRTEAWLEDTAVQAAAALRELKRWVCFPTAGTRDQFVERVADSLIHVALGEWDDLERKKPEKLPRRKGYALLAEPLKVLAVAGLGALVVYFVVAGPGFGALNVGGLIMAFGWVALTILGKLDPSLGEKIISFKQLSGA